MRRHLYSSAPPNPTQVWDITCNRDNSHFPIKTLSLSPGLLTYQLFAFRQIAVRETVYPKGFPLSSLVFLVYIPSKAQLASHGQRATVSLTIYHHYTHYSIDLSWSDTPCWGLRGQGRSPNDVKNGLYIV